MADQSHLLSKIDWAFPHGVVPDQIVSRLRSSDVDIETADLYLSLTDRTWLQIEKEMLQASYPCFIFIDKLVFGYYIPAILRHVVSCQDAFEFQLLVRRLGIHPKKLRQQNLFSPLGLSCQQKAVLVSVLRWGVQLSDLPWKEKDSTTAFLADYDRSIDVNSA